MNQTLSKIDLIKIDYGIHFKGNIIDSAFSYSYCDKFNDLIAISKRQQIKVLNEEVFINDISTAIQEIIESSEVTIDNILYPCKSVQNLTGHQIKKYQIHGDKMVPNISIPKYTERIKNDELYAIETYPSTGKGFATLDYSSDNISHYMLNIEYLKNKPIVLNLSKDEKELLKIINKHYNTLPFQEGG